MPRIYRTKDLIKDEDGDYLDEKGRKLTFLYVHKENAGDVNWETPCRVLITSKGKTYQDMVKNNAIVYDGDGSIVVYSSQQMLFMIVGESNEYNNINTMSTEDLEVDIENTKAKAML